MPEAFVNRIATANPPHDVHDAFLRFGHLMLKGDNRRAALFGRMAERSGIAAHRYSFLEPGVQGAAVDSEGFYRLGAFPDTAARMKKFEACSPGLAVEAVEKLLQGEDRSRITHLIVTSCNRLFGAWPRLLRWWKPAACRPQWKRTMCSASWAVMKRSMR